MLDTGNYFKMLCIARIHLFPIRFNFDLTIQLFSDTQPKWMTDNFLCTCPANHIALRLSYKVRHSLLGCHYKAASQSSYSCREKVLVSSHLSPLFDCNICFIPFTHSPFHSFKAWVHFIPTHKTLWITP